jgi:Uma2 family endonuclease
MRARDSPHRPAARDRAGRAVISVQNPVRLGEGSELQPDLALLRPRRNYYTDRHPEPPDVLLLIEVAEASADYDRNVKVPLYARFGVPVVWLLDLAAPDQLEVYGSPAATGFTEVRRVPRGGTRTVPGLPGTPVAVDGVLGA